MRFYCHLNFSKKLDLIEININDYHTVMGKIWIVIVTFNGMQWLPKSLTGSKTHPVIIVDNNSSDGTVGFIKENFPDVIILSQKRNLGFGAANNIGISYAINKGASYVFLLNQDAYLLNNCIEKLVKVQKANLEFGILSPIHINGKANLLDEQFSHYMNYNGNKNFYSDFVLGKPIQNLYKVPFVNAAGWLISKKCLETVGGFDPIFFHYGEDENYCQRVLFHNFKVGVVTGTYLMHDREFRKKELIKKGSIAYFNGQARSLMILYANINREELLALDNSLKNRKMSRLKSMVKLNFKLAKFYKKEINMLSSIIPQIKKSREINRNRGANYLNL